MSELENSLSINIVFMGGLELLFSNQQSHKVNLPNKVPVKPSKPSAQSVAEPSSANSGDISDAETAQELKSPDVNYLITYLRDNLLRERVELFMEDEKQLRRGILVLINDSDWELEGEGDYQLKSGDEIVFISTLHGG